jgi:phosphatidate cytidylyltransferase
MLLISITAAIEIYTLIKKIYRLPDEYDVNLLWYCLPGALLIILFYIGLFIKIRFIFIISSIGLLVFLLLIGAITIKITGKILSSFGILIGSYIYTSVFPLIIFILRQESQGIFLVYILFLLAWFNDATAYFIGSFFGKTRGIIRFSPNKSLEGYVGSFIFTLALGIILRNLFAKRFPFNTMQAAYTALMIAVCAPLGDLLESLLKRKAGVKDSSRLFPGLGGVLDIFDSILMSAPFYYLLIKIGFSM